jgi:succinate dehydrogenase / fumarate reductase cytochrome b subunit
MSPYMIGPYYKPQLTSILSITSRLMGVFMTVVSTPLALWWLLALMTGPEAYATVMTFMGSLVGQALMYFSLACVCYHFMNGMRHLTWDTGVMLELENIYRTGWFMLSLSIALYVFMLWVLL